MAESGKNWLQLWMRDQRKSHGYSDARQLERALKEVGVPGLSYSVLAAMEGGSRDIRKRPDIITTLASFYDVPVPTEPTAEPSRDLLIEALRDQTAAINALVNRLDLLASSAIRDGVADALREAGVLQAAAASQSEPPHAPRLQTPPR